MFLHFQGVDFGYPEAAHPLFENLTIHFAEGWSGILGPNGAGKTTFLKLAAGLLSPEKGQIESPYAKIYCPQRTDFPPEKLPELVQNNERNANIIRDQLGIEDDWLSRWTTLSHGERKRAQIAVALWQEPDILAVDEPTNHLDKWAREILRDTFASFRGVGLLVSHDRELLDSLCQQCVFIDPPEVVIKPGSYSHAIALRKEEKLAAHKENELRKKEYKRIKREAARRARLADQHRSRSTKKGIGIHDHDAKQKIDMARITGRDVVGGKLLRQLSGRLNRAEQAFKESSIRKEYELGIWLPGSVSQRDLLLNEKSGSLKLGARCELEYPNLMIFPSDRIAITGPNGAGKSTLIRFLLPHLNVPDEHLTYIPQEIDLANSRKILKKTRELPAEKLGHVMTIISCLGSRPQRLLESSIPSPGETRKLLLANGMANLPHIIVMDEPTNHMDLPSIECLENALENCPCSLLLVSHDRPFLNRLTEKSWDIHRADHQIPILRLRIS